jgi:hypothetical protein
MESFFSSKKISRVEENDGEAIIISTMDISTKKLITIPVRGI